MSDNLLRQFYAKPVQISAVQYTGSNFEALQKIAGMYTENGSTHYRLVWDDSDEMPYAVLMNQERFAAEPVYPSAWLVITDRHVEAIIVDSVFAATYLPADMIRFTLGTI